VLGSSNKQAKASAKQGKASETLEVKFLPTERGSSAHERRSSARTEVSRRLFLAARTNEEKAKTRSNEV